MVVYIYGCATCGKNVRRVRKVMKYCRENNLNLEIKYSSHDEENRAEHVSYINQAGLQSDGYPSIVVDDNGKVARLSEWNS